MQASNSIANAEPTWRPKQSCDDSLANSSLPEASGQAAAKHVADFSCALVLLALTLPLIALAAVLIKLTSRGPVFYSQTRVGFRGRLFRIWKLRTMAHNCEARTGAQWSQPGDNRVTKLGRFLRKSHIDELPQLWNVLRGEMSLVGPRPERPEFFPQLEKAIPLYRHRLLVRPGITGLAQIQLPPDTDLASVRRKLAHDLYYVRRMSLWLDLRILLATAFGLFFVPDVLTRFLLRFPGGAPVISAYEQYATVNGNPELQLA